MASTGLTDGQSQASWMCAFTTRAQNRNLCTAIISRNTVNVCFVDSSRVVLELRQSSIRISRQGVLQETLKTVQRKRLQQELGIQEAYTQRTLFRQRYPRLKSTAQDEHSNYKEDRLIPFHRTTQIHYKGNTVTQFQNWIHHQ